jgi:multiple sugar transport system substrate-binding protein
VVDSPADGLDGGRLSRKAFLKRGAALGLALPTLGTALASCGGDESGGSGGGETTLRLWKGPHSDMEKERVGKVIAGFREQNPDVNIEFTVTPWETWDQTYAAGFAGGNPPDIAYMPDQYMVGFADQGALLDLAKYVDAPSYAQSREAWFPNAWELGAYEGVQYGVPFYGGAYVIYVNKELWKKAGLGDPPASREELLDYARRGTDGNRVWGYLAPTAAADSAYFNWFQFFHNAGLNFMNADLTANGFDTPVGEELLRYVSSFYCEQKVTPPAGEYNTQTLLDLFKGGKGMMIMEGSNVLADLQASDLPFELDLFMPPPGPEGETTMGNQGELVVSKACKNPDAAWKFIEYFTSPDVLGPFTEENAFRPLRTDIDVYQGNDLAQKLLSITEGRVQGYEGQLTPKLREVLTALWTEFETALGCGTEPAAAIDAAAGRVDSTLAS